jgi:hypothetical protein
MRAAAAALLMMFVSAPALAGGFHYRLAAQQPPFPAYALSDGDQFGRLAPKYGPPESKSNLQRVAESIGAGRNNGHADFFRYSLSRDDYGNATATGGALAGTFSHGAAELQLRWNTSE